MQQFQLLIITEEAYLQRFSHILYISTALPSSNQNSLPTKRKPIMSDSLFCDSYCEQFCVIILFFDLPQCILHGTLQGIFFSWIPYLEFHYDRIQLLLKRLHENIVPSESALPV